MTFTSQPAWNNTILCVDDDEGILEFYAHALSPEMRGAIESLREARARRRSWRLDEEPVAPVTPPDTFRLLTARSGEEAVERVRLELAEGRSVAAGFFDMKMPGGIDGMETIRRIKEIDPRIMCAVVTAYTDRAISQLATVFKSQDEWIYFNKPFTEWELVQAVRNLVSGWNIRRDRELAMLRLQESNQRMRGLNEQLIDGCLSTVRAVVRTLEARDPCTAGHSQRVARLAVMLARRLELPESEVGSIYQAGLLHDIGKIGVGDAILRKPAPLTSEELAVIRTHPVTGAQILAPVAHLSGVAALVRHHHERFDGSGYPDGLSGRSIPLGSRILAVADTFDALTSTRPYRRACPVARARELLIASAPSQHDPEVSRAFVALLDEEGERVSRCLAREVEGAEEGAAAPHASESAA
jgi:putative nucleotidyltransferase with HDIG domain